MAIPRPINKEMLKKMLLKHMGNEQRSIALDWELENRFLEFLGIDKLQKNEYDDAFLGASELDHSGLIAQDVRASRSGVYMLTERGQKFVSDQIDKLSIPTIDIAVLISRDDLRKIVQDDFCSGRYETAVFQAFKHLEESVRNKAGQPATAIGLPLMSTVFKPKDGLLKHPKAAMEGEIDGLHSLMRGAIALFKNPSSHRTVEYDNEHHAAHILGFANLLLDLLDQCNPA